MKPIEFFKLAVANKAYNRLSWLLSLFSFYRLSEGKEAAPYLIQRDTDGVFFTDPVSNDRIPIEVDSASVPLFVPMDAITLDKDDLPNVSSSTKTTIGNTLFNALVLVEPFGDRYPFITSRISPKTVSKMVEEDARAGNIEVSAFLKMIDNTGFLEGLSQVSVPAASAHALTGHPDRIKLKERLLEENKDKLDDPATIAAIDKALEDLDREWIKGSLSEGFYITDKSYSIVRKRLFYMLGAEQQKDSRKLHLVSNALSEGVEIEDIPAILTTQRLGSFNRGSNTALAGEAVKFYLRAFQNTSVTEEDCGAKLGVTYKVYREDWMDFVNLYEVTGQKPVLITKERAKSLIGETITVRSPAYCKTKDGNLCFTCMGEAVRANPRALGELAAAVGSTFLGAFMSQVHGNALKLVEYDPFETLS